MICCFLISDACCYVYAYLCVRAVCFCFDLRVFGLWVRFHHGIEADLEGTQGFTEGSSYILQRRCGILSLSLPVSFPYFRPFLTLLCFCYSIFFSPFFNCSNLNLVIMNTHTHTLPSCMIFLALMFVFSHFMFSL